MWTLLSLALGLTAVANLWLGDDPTRTATARRVRFAVAAVCWLLAVALLVWPWLPWSQQGVAAV